jgi:hexulose-6-phosphate isomerase
MRVGIMQGRLSPPRERPQSSPWESWQAEFDRAQGCGFDLIEWLIDPVGYERNPIWTDVGMAEIQECMAATGVSVESICADYFVDHPLLRVSEAERHHHLEVLSVLITRAARLGARVIVVPVLEAGEVQNAEDLDRLLGYLAPCLSLAQSGGIALGVESNMPTERYLQLVTRAAHPSLGISFDTGNRTAHGFDIVADLSRLAPHLRGIHIKDRLPDGPNVPLGSGATPFDGFFAALAVSGYRGSLILETTIGDDYDDQARRNLRFVRSHLGRTLSMPVDADV